MKRLFTTALIFLTIFTISAQAQIKECGTVVTKDQYEALVKKYQERSNRSIQSLRNQTIKIPVKIHIVRKADGTGGVDLPTIVKEFDKLNDLYVVPTSSFIFLIK